MSKVDLQKRVLNAFEALPKQVQKNPIFIGVSGGLDSTVLASVALSLRDRLPALHWAHVNYHLRVPDSDKEEQTLREWSRREKIPLHTLSIHPKSKPSNPQAWAREQRLRFFSKLIKKKSEGKGVVWLAHHQQDQAETILHRMIRGSGIKGLGGMSVWEEMGALPIFRPLLGVPRSAIARYAKFHRLPFHQDLSNFSPVYLRNRLRHRVLPLLLEENPRILETLCELGKRSREAAQALEFFAEQWLKKQLLAKNGGCRVPTQNLRLLPSGLVAAIGEKMLQRTAPETQSSNQILPRIQDYLRQPTRKIELPLKGRWRLRMDPSNLSLHRGSEITVFGLEKRSKKKPARSHQSRGKPRNP